MLPASHCAPRRCWPRRRRASTSSATAGSRWGWVPAPSGMQSTPAAGPRLAPGEARRSLEEAIEVLWRIWSGERGIRMDGDHYRLHGAQGGPVPAHRIEVWLGVQGPRMLELLGTKADGWVPSLPRVSLDDLDRGHEIIDLAANEAARSRGSAVSSTSTAPSPTGLLTGSSPARPGSGSSNSPPWQSTTESTASSSGRRATSSSRSAVSPS